jgi:hypothetical protein
MALRDGSSARTTLPLYQVLTSASNCAKTGRLFHPKLNHSGRRVMAEDRLVDPFHLGQLRGKASGQFRMKLNSGCEKSTSPPVNAAGGGADHRGTE